MLGPNLEWIDLSPRSRARRAAQRLPEYGKSGIHDLTAEPVPTADPHALDDMGLMNDDLPLPGYGLPVTLTTEGTVRAWRAIRARQEERADSWSVKELDKLKREVLSETHSGGWLREHVKEIDSRWVWPNRPIDRIVRGMDEDPHEMELLFKYHDSPYVKHEGLILYDSPGTRAVKRSKVVVAPDLDSAPSTMTHESSSDGWFEESSSGEWFEGSVDEDSKPHPAEPYVDRGIVVPSSIPSGASSTVYPRRIRRPPQHVVQMRVLETPPDEGARVYVPSSPPIPPQPSISQRRRFSDVVIPGTP